MKRLIAGFLSLAVAPVVFAQSNPLPPIPEPASEHRAALGAPAEPAAVADATDDQKKPVVSPPAVNLDFSCRERCVPRIWVDAEYLLWWVRGTPVPPLVTTGNPADPLPGALGQPGTQVLLGNSPIGYGALSGARFTVGGWVDNCATVGFEVNGFFLQRGSTSFAAASDPNGNPPLYIPVINRTPTSANFNNEGSIAIADVPNAGIIGNIAVVTSLQLWGAEANGVFNLVRSGKLSVDGIVGFRYMDLKESLTMYGNSVDTTGVGITQGWTDSFSTRNQFYGGQLGLKMDYQVNNWSFETTAKVALGATHESSEVAGSSNWSGAGFPFAPGTYPGGILAEPSNTGRLTGNHFSVVPQVGLKVGYSLTSWVKVTAGYDFLYWNSVVRPGNQIDRNVNFTQIPGAQPFFGPPTAPNVPAPQFNRSDFSASGVSFGLHFSF